MAWLQSHSLWVQEFAEGLAVLAFDPPGKTIRLTRDLQDELVAALVAIEKEPRFRALMIRSLKPGRFAQGLDVAGWKALKAANGVRDWSENGRALWNRLYGLKITTIAWVQGACLGAGFELALACDRIILVNQPSTTLGFSEIDLGLIPSWGGYGPLVRRAGIQNAFPIALGGRRLSVRDALVFGIGDTLATRDEPDYHQIATLARKIEPELSTVKIWKENFVERFLNGRRMFYRGIERLYDELVYGDTVDANDEPRSVENATLARKSYPSRSAPRGLKQKFVERFPIGRRMLYRGIERLHESRLPEAMPAPRAALKVLKEFIEHGPAAGQIAATDALVTLAQTPACDKLIRLHELRDRARSSTSRASNVLREKTIGILGTSPLAMHILTEVIRRDGNVVLRESDEAKLGIAIMKLVRSLGRDLNAGILTSDDTKRLLSRIHSTVTWKKFDEVDLAIDARDRAASLGSDLTDLDTHLPPATPLLVVSSAGRLADVPIAHPRRLTGLAVPGPVGLFPLVEMRRTPATNDAVARRVRDWLASLGWIPVPVGDQPGLLLARLWVPAWNEMVTLLREGVRIDTLENALVRFGLGRGPLEYLDAYGLEHVRDLIEIVRPALEPRIPLDPFWNDVLERGWRGQSSGKGFYLHGRRRKPNRFLVHWLHQEGPLHGPAPQASDEAAICDRVIMLMVNEAFRCLDEQRIESNDDLDLAMMLTDWAPHHGGPIHYAHTVGLSITIVRLRELAVHGSRYEPCARLLAEATGMGKPDA